MSYVNNCKTCKLNKFDENLLNLNFIAIVLYMVLSFLDIVVTKKIPNDRETEFKSKGLKNFCNLYCTELHYTTSKKDNFTSPVKIFQSSLIESFRYLKINPLLPDHLIKRAILRYGNSIHCNQIYSILTK